MTSIQKYQNHNDLLEGVQKLCDIQWQQSDISFNKITDLIKFNSNLIFHPPEDRTLASSLQAAILQLSNKINDEFNTPQAHVLAFDIMGYAKGIFNSDVTPYCGTVPEDVLSYNILPLLSKQTLFVSKGWCRSRKVYENALINQNALSPKQFGCKTAKEAVQFIIDRKLSCANLTDFPDINEEDLNRLIKNSPSINRLFIKTNIIDEDKLAEALKSLASLTSLDLSGCRQITEDKLAQWRTQFPQINILR